MRLTVVSYGSEGDTRPFVALCHGLIQAGHEVLLLAEHSSLGSARRHGVPAQALAGALQSILPLSTPLRAVRASTALITAHAESWMRAITAHAQYADGVLYSSLAAHMGATVALALGKPGLGLWLQPTTPTTAFAAPTFAAPALPGWLNRLTYHVAPDAVVRRLYGSATRSAARRLFGSSAISPVRDPNAPILYGFSRHLVDRPRDWPSSHLICGHWSLPSRPWEPPQPLLDFLRQGPPPLYIGFGAMASFFRRTALDAIVAAVAGRRAVFFPGWSDVSADMLPQNFHVVGDTPHDWLLPQTSVVVHHGGAGTTHAAARAGIPSIVLPVAVDQFFWAGRLAALGVAPAPLRATRLSPSGLSSRIETAHSEPMRARARALGAALAEEDGVARAVRAVEACLSR